MAEKDLKNEDYGVFHYRIEENACTHLLKLFDNKSTTLERRRKKFKCNAEEKSSSAMSWYGGTT